VSVLAELKVLGNKVKQSQGLIKTEEATKQAFIVPFIKILGYDVYDPTEVVPEYIADIGIKKGEKVDYAIMRDGKPIMLIECKQCGVDLDKHTSQLYRYFSVTPTARIALLTNGVIFRFYADLEKANLMDSKPFLELNLLNIDEILIAKLEKLSKSRFALNSLLFAATEPKYIREINQVLYRQLAKPSDDFVKFFASQVYSGKVTQGVLEQFREIVKKALRMTLTQIVYREVEKRLKPTKEENIDTAQIEPEPSEIVFLPELLTARSTKQRNDERIETTQEELEGFNIVRNISKKVVDLKRIFYRDAINYFSVLLDDNNRKPICRLYFNDKQKYIALFDKKGNEDKIPIEKVQEIKRFEERLKNTLLKYEERK